MRRHGHRRRTGRIGRGRSAAGSRRAGCRDRREGSASPLSYWREPAARVHARSWRTWASWQDVQRASASSSREPNSSARTASREAVFEFRRALLDWPDHAYQVIRSEFDQLLYEHGRLSLGATGLSGATASVRELDAGFRGGRDDCTGSGAWCALEGPVPDRCLGTLYRRLADAGGKKRPDPNNDSAAIFGHFRRGCRAIPGKRGGNIRIHLTRIPAGCGRSRCRADVTSIGWVAPSTHMGNGERPASPSSSTEHCRRHPHIAADAGRRRTGRTAAGDGQLSPTARRRSVGDCHIKVGDAYGFIDPIFSTGVHLALVSATEAARTVLAIRARSGHGGTHALAAYHQPRSNGDSKFVSWFIYRIRRPGFRHLMVNAEQHLRDSRSAIISLLAADFRPRSAAAGRVLRCSSSSAIFLSWLNFRGVG